MERGVGDGGWGMEGVAIAGIVALAVPKRALGRRQPESRGRASEAVGTPDRCLGALWHRKPFLRGTPCAV
jgi:hypothetical protein